MACVLLPATRPQGIQATYNWVSVGHGKPPAGGDGARDVDRGMPWQRVMHRVWTYGHARLAVTIAACKVLVHWHGFQPYASAFVPLSMAAFSL